MWREGAWSRRSKRRVWKCGTAEAWAGRAAGQASTMGRAGRASEPGCRRHSPHLMPAFILSLHSRACRTAHARSQAAPNHLLNDVLDGIWLQASLNVGREVALVLLGLLLLYGAGWRRQGREGCEQEWARFSCGPMRMATATQGDTLQSAACFLSPAVIGQPASKGVQQATRKIGTQTGPASALTSRRP